MNLNFKAYKKCRLTGNLFNHWTSGWEVTKTNLALEGGTGGVVEVPYLEL